MLHQYQQCEFKSLPQKETVSFYIVQINAFLHGILESVNSYQIASLLANM